MHGMNSATGKVIGGIDHLRQSVRDILTTPTGTRVQRRDYGSDLFSLIDAPTNRGTLAQIYAATADALIKWEPRLLVSRVSATQASPGRITLDIAGTYLPDGRTVTLSGIEISS